MSGFSVRFTGFKMHKPRRGTFRVNWGMVDKIEDAVEKSKPYRDYIARVFQVANRRIQNIESAGLLSPAVVSLNKGDIKGFTKFSMKGSWPQLKEEFAKAIAFLNDETSTASGARQFKEAMRKQGPLSNEPDKFEEAYRKAMGKTDEMTSDAQANIRYRMAVDMIIYNVKSASYSVMGEVAAYEQQIQDAVHQSAIDFFKRLENGNVIM